MLREHFSPHSLSARVFRLIVCIVLLVELLAVVPGMERERHEWLMKRMTEGELVEASLRGGASPMMQDTLLRLSENVAVSVTPGPVDGSPPGPAAIKADAVIDLSNEGWATATWRAGIAALGLEAPYARVYASCPLPCRAQVEVIVSQTELARHLQIYVLQAAAIAAVVAMVTGGVVFLALDQLLVRPMQVMTASIAGFRRNPGYAGVGGLQWLAGRRDDEISRAARELVAMQGELRAALWRNARLAALGTAVAKISHDLRNILTSALLVTDRLHRHDDAVVQQAANTLIPAMERAVELVSRTVDFAQEGPPALNRSPVALHALASEVADMLHATDSSTVIDNQLPESLVLSLDRSQIYRVLVNLMRNSLEAGATRITLKLERENGTPLLVLGDNGPGLPGKVVASLFRPFNAVGHNGGAGLGLAIARDLVRAHGGEVLLRRTGPEGTEFAMSLPGDPQDETARAAGPG